MQTPSDPVDRALASLAGRAWPGGTHNTQLESTLMRSFVDHRPAPFLARHRVLVPTLVVLLVAGVAFAAAGGLELVKGWFITTSINGQVVDQRTVVPNDDGSVTFTVPAAPRQDGEPAVVEMTLQDDDGDATTTKVVNVTVATNGEEAEVTVTPQPPEE